MAYVRILLVNTVASLGSTGKICMDLYKSLKDAGHEVCIAYGRGSLSKNFKQYKIENRFGMYKHVLESRIFDNTGLSSKKATKKFISFIKNYNPDIIHLHNLHGYYLNYPILFDFIKRNDYKTIWTLHDCWPFSPHSAFFDFDNKNYKFVTRKELKEYPKTWGLNRSNRNFDLKKRNLTNVKKLYLVTPSKWLANGVEKSFLKSYPLTIINNGVDRKIFFKDKSYACDNKKMILGVANIWDDRKGLNFFLELAKKIDTSYKIVLVGKINKNNRILAKQFTNIKIIEQTKDQKELASIYRKAYVFINPTLKDNFPTTNLEAISCGTPVITFDTGGSSEIITKSTGIISEEKNAEAILYGIKTIEEKYRIGDFKELGENRYKFSKEMMTDEYLNLYRKVIRDEKNTTP